MSETPINLNKVRKARQRDAARKAADENAVKFGRTKSEKARDKGTVTQLTRKLDQHKRDPET